MPAPTFLLAGVPKAGTTSFYHYLSQHPQVFLSPIKEPTFFAIDRLRQYPFIERSIQSDRAELRRYLEGPLDRPAPFYITEWDDYLELFRNAGDRPAVGEASANYFWLPGAPEAIHAAIPDARLIFLLRDPADRLFSWYLLDPREPRGSFREWFSRECSRDNSPAVISSRYGSHLQRFFATFPARNLCIHLYEDYRGDTALVLQKTFTFLGIDPDVEIDTSVRHNQTFIPRFPILHRLRRYLPAARLPAGLRRMLGRPRATVTLAPADRQLVIDHYRPEILKAADLIGRDLGAWLR